MQLHLFRGIKMGCVDFQRNNDSLDLYFLEDRPIGEDDARGKVTIPYDASKMRYGDVATSHLQFKNDYELDLCGIPAICAELDVCRAPGYEDEVDEIYLMWIKEINEVVGIRRSVKLVEGKGYSETHHGPFKPSKGQIEKLEAVGIDLKVLKETAAKRE